MTLEIPFAVVIAAAVNAGCMVAGALIGVGVVLVRMRGGQRG